MSAGRISSVIAIEEDKTHIGPSKGSELGRLKPYKPNLRGSGQINHHGTGRDQCTLILFAILPLFLRDPMNPLSTLS